ncbi:MAG: thrombospondin type 3 repeat-containing protein [Candidatus Poseidonia sp.]|nr:thrombospondin type 3 repeat-containing protein [Poseidonia sp.]
MKKQVAISVLIVLLLSLPSYATAEGESDPVEKFGVGFNEVVIADASDDLSSPRDLEFHPGRTNELWIANRGTDSITIVENTGLANQTSQNREDSNSNHFLEEVSAIAFGAYDEEFDWMWGSAQESVNTYCGQGAADNFMGPALWPSSLDHYAVENQNNGNGLLGSHIDMNHESPYGVGIAHDYDNVYWYNDGYYGELVRYDFKEDHDTGQDDHSDAVVHRYSEIQLSHFMGKPGHMIMDKDTGILYIADAGANRVVWVNTDDPSTNKANIMNDASRLEPLAEYSRITGVEWGVLATGLNIPSGIALADGQLFISENGNGKIAAYELAADGKSATFLDKIQTTATSIMGLEVGPQGHLFYVDNAQNEVVRIDPYEDDDGDGVGNEVDNCPATPNPFQLDRDGDAYGDACDDDDDNDGVLDLNDDCAVGHSNWTASISTDHDADGCHDAAEDQDDDNDGMNDQIDLCALGALGWQSSTSTDYDGDGCEDAGEDVDDDNDRICDASDLDDGWACTVSAAGSDLCPMSPPSFTSYVGNDIDRDGCEDAGEDLDDDNDGTMDDVDDCPLVPGTSSLGDALGCADFDNDGYSDSTDEFPTEPTQWFDADEDGYGDNPDGFEGDGCAQTAGTSTADRFGCADADGDGWSDLNDAFPTLASQHADGDGDGYGDSLTGFQPDACPAVFGSSTEDRFGCADTDGDGWSDLNDAFPNEATQHEDADGDGYGENADGVMPDSCPGLYGLSSQQSFGCPDSDGDGWENRLDAYDDAPLLWSDTDGDGYADQQGTNLSDDCPEESGTSFEDRKGCLDGDGDGWSDDVDVYPMDASKHVEEEGDVNSMLLYVGVPLLLMLVGVLLFFGRKRSSLSTGFDATPTQLPAIAPMAPLQPQAPPAMPPLPAEGLPAGWSMEQWAYYGEEYLKNR